MSKKIKKYERITVMADLKDFYQSCGKNDYMEITEWNNGEGFDICLHTESMNTFSLSYNEFSVLKKLIKKL